MAAGFITVHVDLRGTEIIEALARLYSVCRRMEAERTSDRPTDEEYRAAMLAAALALRKRRATVETASTVIAWLYEDTLPPEYPYDAMFPYSRVDGVRMFPVFAPPSDQSSRSAIDDADSR